MSVTDPITAPPSSSSARTIAAVTVVLALIAGMMIGVVGDRIWMWKHPGRAFDRASRTMTPRILARLDSELHLDNAQHAAVARILEAHRQKMSVIFKQISPQVRQQIDAANAEIENVLSPEQRTRFETMKMKMRGPGSGSPRH